MISVKSPTRVDLSGGTLDCWPLNLFIGDCVTVNLAIDIYTGCELVPKQDDSVRLQIQDLKYDKTFKNLNAVLSSDEPELLLVQKVLAYTRPKFGFDLKTFSQSPVGGGLGGSSSLCISLLKAFGQMSGFKLAPLPMVEVAHNIEAKIIKAPTGTQDYVPAILGGLNFLHYTCDGLSIESSHADINDLAKNFILVYTGKSHHSGINNWQVIKSVVEGDQNTLSALKEIAAISYDTANVCRQEKWHKLPELFRSEYDSRIKLTPYFTSPEIEKIKKLVMAKGAEAVKICGAGGGGCILVWAEPGLHEGIKAQCQENGFQPLNIKPVQKNQSH